MITFDLACEHGHRFEGWFRNGQDFEEQLAREFVSCPLCGSHRVTKQLSPVAVHVARRTAPVTPPTPQPEATEGLAAPSAPSPGPARPVAFFHALARFVEEHFEDVGPAFAAEARKIEEGEAEQRNIRGTTTAKEEESLREDGIEFLKIPVPKYDA
jgi:hypothetical protein